MRHLAIGDIHGCATAFSTLLDFVKIREDDLIITLGDYVNRGPQSRDVVARLIELHETGQLIPLRGNHEIMMLAARDSEEKLNQFLKVGGDKTLQSYDEDFARLLDAPSELEPWHTVVDDIHWDFIEERLHSYYESDNHFYVHANAYAEAPLNEQPEFMLYWEKFNDPSRHESGKVMVCGHSSQRSGLPKSNLNAICIDTKAHAGGWLSCLHVESGHLWQANEEGQTRQLAVDELDQDSPYDF
jgi:serine/threonine protein phosphatase 1